MHLFFNSSVYFSVRKACTLVLKIMYDIVGELLVTYIDSIIHVPNHSINIPYYMNNENRYICLSLSELSPSLYLYSVGL